MLNGGTFKVFLDTPLLAVGAGTLCFWALLAYFRGETHKLRRIPTAYSTIPVVTFIQSWLYVFQGKRLVDLSVRKWPKALFRIPEAQQWTVVASDRKMVGEVLRLHDVLFSSSKATEELVQMKYTLGPEILDNPYHIPIFSNQLRKSLPILVPQVHEEVVNAFESHIPFTEDWVPIKSTTIVPKIICQASNRIFVGYPLCRDPQFMELSTTFTFDAFTVAFVLRWTPVVFRPMVNALISNIPKQKRKALKHLGPLIDARRAERAKSEGAEQPVDLLTWLLDISKEEDATNEALANRILATNFGAIHTSSMTFNHALYHLAANPAYAEILRDEVDVVLQEYGWTKDGLDHMHKVDSFLKESQRITPIGNVGLGRVALKDHTLADGTFIPEGTNVSINVHGPHFDEEVYADPHTFDPLRFVKLQEKTTRTQDMTATSANFLGFGHGRHACPGRYFAASELKMMLAYVVAYYDVKFIEEGKRPADLWLLTSCLPNQSVDVLFRKRRS